MSITKAELRKLIDRNPGELADIIRTHDRAMVALAREDSAMFAAYVLRDELTNKPITMAPIHDELHQILNSHHRACIWALPEFGKCEVTGTPVLLADGSWKEIQDIDDEVEIILWDSLLRQFRTAKAGPVERNGHRATTELRMESGRRIRCTYDHPWHVLGRGWTHANEILAGDEITTINHLPMDFPASDMTVDEARMLGYMADGSYDDRKGLIALPRAKELESVRELFSRLGFSISLSPKRLEVTQLHVDNPTPIEVFRVGHKYFNGMDVAPDLYRASTECIIAYFRALFSRSESQGTMSAKGIPGAIFVRDRSFAEALIRLGLRIGAAFEVSSGAQERVYRRGWYKVSPRTRFDLEQYWPTSRMSPDKPRIVKGERVVAVYKSTMRSMTWGLPVHDKEFSYISNGYVSHNTNQISVAYALWCLGRNPNMNIMVVASSKSQAQKILSKHKEMIEASPELAKVFPTLKPGNKWASDAITVARETIRKDPSITCAGRHTKIQGARVDLLILDDVDDLDSTSTPMQRQDTMRWVESTPMSRLSPDAQVVAVGNVWDAEDVMHNLSKKAGWYSKKFPVVDAQGNSTWPEKFTPEVIEQKRIDHGPIEFRRLFLCEERNIKESRFRIEWIEQCLAAGKGKVLLDYIEHIDKSYVCVTGVDLGHRKKAGADPTSMATVVMHPDGQFELVGLRAGIWNAQEIMDNMIDIHKRYQCSISVESNGAQEYLLQLMQIGNANIPIKAHFTGKNKRDPIYGVESVAAEMATGKWILPSVNGEMDGADHETRVLIDEMLDYTPAKHTGDRLMALWIAREAARQMKTTSPNKAWVGRLNLRVR